MNSQSFFSRRTIIRLLFVSAITHPALAQPSTGVHPFNALPSMLLPKAARGEAAITELGSNLGSVARAYGFSSDRLKTLLEQDPSLWVQRSGYLTYVDAGMTVKKSSSATAASTSGAAPYALDQTFKLHSLAGAQRTIYLDFTGHTTSNTQWNTSYTGGADIVSAAFDIDGDPTTFNDTERERIQRIWQRVVEDFSPFSVDVTTEDPGVDAIVSSGSSDTVYGVRVVISPTSSWLGEEAGGVAFLNSFGYSKDTPCFVFSNNLGPNDEKYVAEAASHEAGHTLGLSHQGTTTGDEYYSGQGDWAPIMGVGYYKSITQWAKGEYSRANNTEDAVSIISDSGAPIAADDHANNRADATALTSATVSTGGFIEQASDRDLFRFDAAAGTVDLSFAGPAPENNVDIKAELLDPTGTVLTTANPDGLSAALNYTLTTGGTYFLRVQGTGSGEPTSTGYSNYGSIGQYVMTGSLPEIDTTTGPTASISATPSSGAAPLEVTFSASGSAAAGDGSLVTYSWDFGDGSSGSGTDVTHTYNDKGDYTAILTVVDNRNRAGLKSTAITVTGGTTPNDEDDEDEDTFNIPPFTFASASPTSGTVPLSVQFDGSRSRDIDGSIASYSWDFGDGTTSTEASPSKTYQTAGTYTPRLTVTDNQGATGSSGVSITATTASTKKEFDIKSFTLSVTRSGSKYYVSAAVVLNDSAGQPVSGSQITVRWSGGGLSGTSKATTGSDGKASFTSSRAAKKNSTVTVTALSLTVPSGYTYKSSLYSEPVSRSIKVQ